MLAWALYQSLTLLRNAAGSEQQPKLLGLNVARAAPTTFSSLTETRSIPWTCPTAWKKTPVTTRSSVELQQQGSLCTQEWAWPHPWVFYPTVVPEGTGRGVWSTLNSSQMLTSFCASHQMATIFVVNIRVGGRGWAPWRADDVIVFSGAAWNQVWPAKPFPGLLSEHTHVLFLGRIFHKFLSTVDLAHFLAHALVVFGDVGMTIIIES